MAEFLVEQKKKGLPNFSTLHGAKASALLKKAIPKIINLDEGWFSKLQFNFDLEKKVFVAKSRLTRL